MIREERILRNFTQRFSIFQLNSISSEEKLSCRDKSVRIKKEESRGGGDFVKKLSLTNLDLHNWKIIPPGKISLSSVMMTSPAMPVEFDARVRVQVTPPFDTNVLDQSHYYVQTLAPLDDLDLEPNHGILVRILVCFLVTLWDGLVCFNWGWKLKKLSNENLILNFSSLPTRASNHRLIFRTLFRCNHRSLLS